MGDVDLTALVRCSPRSRTVTLEECLEEFKEDAVNLRVRGAVAGRCSRCSDGRQRRMLVAEGRMPPRAGEPRPHRATATTATPAPTAPAIPPPAPPDNDCDDGNPCTEATPATAAIAAAAADPALLAAIDRLTGAVLHLAERIGQLRVSDLVRAALATDPPATPAPARARRAPRPVPATTPTPAPPTVATTTATEPTRAPAGAPAVNATPEPARLTAREALKAEGLSATVRLDGAPARVLCAAAAAGANWRVTLRALTSGAEAKVQQALWTAARDLSTRGLISPKGEGVYEVTTAGREYAARLVRARAAAGVAP